MTVPLLTCCFVLSWVDFPSCDSVILTRIYLSLPLTKRVLHRAILPITKDRAGVANFLENNPWDEVFTGYGIIQWRVDAICVFTLKLIVVLETGFQILANNIDFTILDKHILITEVSAIQYCTSTLILNCHR